MKQVIAVDGGRSAAAFAACDMLHQPHGMVNQDQTIAGFRVRGGELDGAPSFQISAHFEDGIIKPPILFDGVEVDDEAACVLGLELIVIVHHDRRPTDLPRAGNAMMVGQNEARAEDRRGAIDDAFLIFKSNIETPDRTAEPPEPRITTIEPQRLEIRVVAQDGLKSCIG